MYVENKVSFVNILIVIIKTHGQSLLSEDVPALVYRVLCIRCALANKNLSI